jgi:hypothetical protein
MVVMISSFKAAPADTGVVEPTAGRIESDAIR